jgi:hypothetical protein
MLVAVEVELQILFLQMVLPEDKEEVEAVLQEHLQIQELLEPLLLVEVEVEQQEILVQQ